MIDLLDNPLFDEAPNGAIPTATHQIYNFIGEYLKRDKDTHVNRASAASMCVKRRWYQSNGYEGTPITPRKMVNFLLGDLSEKTLLYFIKSGCVGNGLLYSEVDFGKEIGRFTVQGKPIGVYEQENLSAQIGDIEVSCHVDGWGKRTSDGQWELIEIKSAADYGYDRFKDSGPGDYLNQAHVNMRTNKAIELGVNQVRFFYLKKNTGHLWDRLFEFDQSLFNQVVKDYAIAAQKIEPRRPYSPKSETFRGKPTGRTVLPFPCNGYCPYTEKCWPGARFEWKGDKPMYVIKENVL